MLCNSASLFGGPNGVRTRVSALRGPCPRPLDDGAGRASTARVYSLCSRRTSVAAETKMAGGGGLEPPLPGPEPGVLPLDDPPARRPLYVSMFPGVKAALGLCVLCGAREKRNAGRHAPARRAALENGRLQRAARLEARHLLGRNANRLARARVAAVALGAAAHHERPEAADGDAAAAAQRIEHAAHARLEHLLRPDLRAAGCLRHRGDEIGLGHAPIYPMRWREVKRRARSEAEALDGGEEIVGLERLCEDGDARERG